MKISDPELFIPIHDFVNIYFTAEGNKATRA